MPFYARCLRPLLFRLDAETAHHASVAACQWAALLPGMRRLTRSRLQFTAPELECQAAGLDFANPIGLAAGWDKSGRALRMLDQLGFGFAEIGSISAQPSQGNPRPRLFRLPAERAIVVNYGLPNDGAVRVAARLGAYHPRIPIGVNIVTTNHGPAAPLCTAEEILRDYVQSVGLVQGHAAYLTLNLSCPNAADGKDFFGEPGRIAELLTRLNPLSIPCPVFLKLPPSDEAEDHARWLAEVEPFGWVRGFIFNLAPGKPHWLRWQHAATDWNHLPGAVAGAPVAQHLNRCIAQLYTQMDRERYIIIGGGGVFSAEDAWQKICLGASLVQVYSGLVYEGPTIVRRINSGLLERLRQHGWQSISQAVGSSHR
jgi:dihydroorotate dehydrogenase